MTSHEYANRLEKLAAELRNRPDFDLPTHSEGFYADYGLETFRYYQDKAKFLAAVRALGSGEKGGRADEMTIKHGDLRLAIYRDAVCKLVKPAQPAEYECEPLLSEAETAEIG